jgi:hypothetical protein
MAKLYAGSTMVDITPKLGHNLAGWIDIRPADRQDTSILAHVLALVQDKESALLITCDLVGLDEELRKNIENSIQAAFGIPAKNIFILPSHNHFGPSVNGSYAHDSQRTSQETEYREALIQKTIQAVGVALDRIKPVNLFIGYDQETVYARNSRFWRRDGTINWLGKMHKEFEKDSGPFDAILGALKIEDEENNAIATLYNFACHANAAEENGFSTISWDWPGYASQFVTKALGGESLFLVGACGDVHPVREGIAKEMGLAIGEGILKAIGRSDPLSCNRLEVIQQDISLQPRDFSSFDPGQILSICSQMEDKKVELKIRSIFMEILNDLKGKALPDYQRQLRVLMLGDLAMVFIPGELFAGLGLELKRRSPFRNTFVVESLAESIGYIPDQIAYENGGYQSGVGTRVASGVGEMLVRRSLELLEELDARRPKNF